MKSRLLLVVLSMLCAGTVFAQPYPVKPIRIVVTSFGSGPDLMARLIGRRLTEAWGQQVIVDAGLVPPAASLPNMWRVRPPMATR